ncbi:hypothetical protein GW916_04730 [bacterium]|nr:hypothetical protein [bacterium]
MVLKNSFSYAAPALLGIAPMSGSKMPIINVLELPIQIELREDLEILGAEILWTVNSVVVKPKKGESSMKTYYLEELRANRPPLRINYSYSESTMVSFETLREVHYVPGKHQTIEEGSRHGYKKVTLRRDARELGYPLNHNLEPKNENEAYLIPWATPYGIRFITKDLQVLTHYFESEEKLEAEIANMPDELGKRLREALNVVEGSCEDELRE